MQYMADPLSREDIRQFANLIRAKCGLKYVLMLPVLRLLEVFGSIIEDLSFNYEIIDDNALPEDKHAEYNATENCVYIKNSVYQGAFQGCGRDRMTIVHELSHAFLIKVSGVNLYRSFGESPIPAYKDPEWQAKCLAGELMMPINLIKDMSPSEIAKECGVSLDAANYHKSKMKNIKR